MFVSTTTQVYFFLYEMVEMSYNVKDYFESLWNCIDLPIFAINIIYLVIRINNIEECFYPFDERPSINHPQYVTMIILNVVIIISGVFKIMFYLRVYDDFGQLVKLMGACFQDIVIFSLFMLMSLLGISILFTIVGAEFSDEDYPNLPF